MLETLLPPVFKKQKPQRAFSIGVPAVRRVEKEIAEKLKIKSDESFLEGMGPEEREMMVTILREMADSPDAKSRTLEAMYSMDYRERPVDMEKFLDDPDYLGHITKKPDGTPVLFPAWRELLLKFFSPGSLYQELILGGAVGVGKSSVAAIVMDRIIYQCGCLRDPHDFYGLMKGNDIVFGIYSITKAQSADTIYGKMRSHIDSSKWFGKNLPINDKLLSRIQFKRSSMHVKVGSKEFHTLGADVLAFSLDEINFFAAAKGNKANNDDPAAAMAMYSESKTRQKSRFMQLNGKVAGAIVLCSSKRSQASFLETHVKNSKDDIEKGFTMLAEYAQWDVKPKHLYVLPKFNVEVGDKIFPSRILGDKEYPRQGARVIEVPGEHLDDFKRDIEKNLRDLAGVATFGMSNFFKDGSIITAAYSAELQHPFTKVEFEIGNQDDVEIHSFFRPEKLFNIDRSAYRIKRHPGVPRFWHLDLALTRCNAGLAIGHQAGNRVIMKRRADGTLYNDRVPLLEFDLLLRINPPKYGVIDFSKIRSFMLSLRDMGMPFVHGTMDQFQSADMSQILEKEGFSVKHQSVSGKNNDEAYLFLRQAYIEGRVKTYDYAPIVEELTGLEHDLDTREIEKAPGGVKDLGDSMAGVAFTVMTDGRAGKNVSDLIPGFKSVKRVDGGVKIATVAGDVMWSSLDRERAPVSRLRKK